MNTKTSQLYEYLMVRSKHTQMKFEESPAAIEEMFLKGQRKFHGVTVNNQGTVMNDETDPSLYFRLNM